VSGQFFERQEVQRSQTRWLVAAFVAAILVVVSAMTLVLVVGFAGDPVEAWDDAPGLISGTFAMLLAIVLGACWHKSSQLRAGGAVVARSLGGVQINNKDNDLARQRLVNVVEEMAIAARVRKPQVFVLPDEQGINAFAAGHSPDEAAVAVTQGALDNLDRDQLQAVIGHEFSHILNGDMKINMRLAAWIFGLFVITDLASRIMSSRRGGKDAARLKAIAFAVFLAGSFGMIAGRLLQAAVSRRREHLADASAVQFTRNPQALQSAFIVMAAHAEGTRLHHAGSADVAHMFFAGSAPSWANKVGGKWFATHPPLEERVHAIDSRVTPLRFRTLVSDERRKLASRAKAAGAETAATAEGAAPAAGAAPMAGAATNAAPIESVSGAAPIAAPIAASEAMPTMNPDPGITDAGATAAAAPVADASPAVPIPPISSPASTGSTLALAATMPFGVPAVPGRALPPDPLRNRLSTEQQAQVQSFVARVEDSLLSVQATLVATLLAPEPAKARQQLARLAPLLGIELLKASQSLMADVHALALPARIPVFVDLLPLLDSLEPEHRKRLRAIVRAFAPTVATGDMLRFTVTRVLDKKLAKPKPEAPPVPLPDRSDAVGALYAALAQCRFGAGKQGQNSYRAGLMGMLPPQKWPVYPESTLTPADLDAALSKVAEVHPTGKRAFSDGLARVISVGGRLTVPQVELLRGICFVVECAVPLLPVDVVYEENEAPPLPQVSAR
jgi:Zn-dependent protease with chaperone function